MYSLTTKSLSAAFMLTLSSAVWGGEAEDKLIDRVVAVYGGDKLSQLNSLVFNDNLRRFTAGQSHSPREVDLSYYRPKVIIDFAGGRKEMRMAGGEADDFYLLHNVFDGEKGYRLNHQMKTITENRGYSFGNVDRRFSLGVDTIVVKLLLEARDKATFEGDVMYQGRPHSKIAVQPEGFPKLTLFIDNETGLLTKATRPHWLPNTEFAYLYSGYRKQDGITYASSYYQLKGGKPEAITISRKIEMNPKLNQYFDLPTSYGESPKTLAFADMTAKKLAEGVYQAGQHWGFSLFVDAGDYFIGLGGYEGLSARFEAVQKFSGLTKPLKYQVVSHHHTDHLGGMKEAAELGADFITVVDNIQSIRDVAGIAIEDERFAVMSGKMSFGEGAIEILDFPNGHAAHNLVAYIPSAKMVFTADLFVTRLEKGAPNGSERQKLFRAALADNGVDAEFFASAHSGRVLTASDLDAAISNIPAPPKCPAGWDNCYN